MSTDALHWQPSLFATGVVGFDTAFAGVTRRELAEGAWVDHQPAWVHGADELFDLLLEITPLQQHDIWMYERRLPEPRLTHRWRTDAAPAPPSLLVEMAGALSEHYGVAFTQIGVNLYRDGNDSVAWHGDRIAREMPEAIVALVSLGEPRAFKLRPKGGGTSITYLPDRGDLLVLGGSCQRTWDHAVPKVRRAGPRMSVQFRHAYDR
jgi:alkylated DNA repair dioxygenase AlkB